MSTITLEMPNNDAEALLRFLHRVDVQKECPSDPYERSRLEGALEALLEALEQDLR
ncbi:TPA: hypothetical protein ACRMZW_004261 [Pseudomonas aeruginosa]|jgi:hypothetical protein